MHMLLLSHMSFECCFTSLWIAVIGLVAFAANVKPLNKAFSS